MVSRDAVISDDGRYRYVLTRWWMKGPKITWVMLNPSTADMIEDDPTIRRCVRFSAHWGYGSLDVVNLFAYRATKPEKLLEVEDPVGRLNEHHVYVAIKNSGIVIAAWGAFASKMNGQRLDVVGMCQRQKVPLQCLGVTKTGEPRHPLYMPVKTEPIDFPVAP